MRGWQWTITVVEDEVTVARIESQEYAATDLQAQAKARRFISDWLSDNRAGDR
jgi:hypothetical protein